MIGHLYRYQHPVVDGLWLYVGQGLKRDKRHRKGITSFGRRFYRHFPAMELPPPVRWTVEAKTQLELNEEETIAMFQYHTWHTYAEGMNLTVPGSHDYADMSRIAGGLGGRSGTHEGHARAGRIGGKSNKDNHTGICALTHDQRAANGRKLAESGHLDRIRTSEGSAKGGRTQGRINAETNHFTKIKTPESLTKGGRVAYHLRWHVKRNILNPVCVLCLTSKTEVG